VTANKLFDLLNKYFNWGVTERYANDFEVRIEQSKNEYGNLIPLYEIKAKTQDGNWYTIHYWPDGKPTFRSQRILSRDMYDHEGIFLTEKEFNAIKKFLDETGQA
jgi:hypothetical protein